MEPHQQTQETMPDAAFLAEVRAAVEPTVKEIKQLRDETLQAHNSLLKLWKDGVEPNHQAVRALEQRLDQHENAMLQAGEHARQEALKTKGTTPSAGGPKGDVFRDVFIRDSHKVVEAFRTGGYEAMHRALTSEGTLATAGALNPDQESQFLDWTREQQIALSRINIRRMVANAAFLDEIVLGTRKLRRGAEATAEPVANGISTARRQLNTVETVWGEDLSYSFIEDNIEGGGIESTIARLLAIGFGNDHNDLFWNGDEDNSDPFLGINDGIIDIAKADVLVNDLDATSISEWTKVFNAALKLMPFAFQARPDHAFFIPFRGTFVYADELATRETALGDAVTVEGRDALRYFGVPVLGEPHMQADEAVLSPLVNLTWGVQRGITFEADRVPRKRAIEYTLSARTDQNYAKSQAMVLIDNIPAALR